ncbi:winged helix DNA-binding domain-containing protein [Dictyobacter aurantiacus]|uniref:Winged helix DNA-binding domain-containing protein n=1 Tax=Dictyobacter aurantiacus TaxID=1936993 RepID=A0A401ZMY3_9CHLR|nr:winged helix DNA-binding domain-containing protein [Dictyobacter aurantiacus]GCE08231.1 hypothetical protein KDAU_55600 [Dictyobacter aurantiacus]
MAAAAEILTTRQLNRALLARQLLLVRSSLSASAAVEQLVGLQAQTSNAPYIGLWTRLQEFQRQDLSDLLQQRQAVRATLMRSTLHIFTAKDYLDLRTTLQPALTRALGAFFGQRAKGLDIEQLVAAARNYVEEQPRTFTEIRALLTGLVPNGDPEAMAYVVRTHLPLVQVPPGGFWGSAGSPAHATANSWLGQPLNSEEKLADLTRRYLAAFGPASVRDLQAWSGLVRLQGNVEKLKPGLRVYRSQQGQELFDLPDQSLPPADIEALPRFLPEYDNLILSHYSRERIVPEEYRSLVYLSAGRVRATFLLDGFVSGTWKTEKSGKSATLIIEPFQPLSADNQLALEAEGNRLLRFIFDDAETHNINIHHPPS